MSVATGLEVQRIPIIPLNQTTGDWTGNGVPITYLNKGVYSIMYNYGFNANAGSITSTFAMITSNQPYLTAGYKTLVSSPYTGLMGSAVFIQSMMNNVVIDTDNTPIYLTITNTITAGTNWSIQINNQKYTQFFNRVVIIKFT